MRKRVNLKKPGTKYAAALLIDDNQMDNFINQKILEATSFADHIYVNTNGLGALEFLNNLNQQPDQLDAMLPEVIFVDLNMPLVNGFQFIEKFYQLPEIFKSSCKLVILTSSTSQRDEETAARLSSDIVFLHKPLTAEALSKL